MSKEIEERLKGLKPVCGLLPRYRLRWRFKFLDRPDIYGGWNDTRQAPDEMAFRKSKAGLIVAQVEGEAQGYWTTKVLLEVDGHEYASARWRTAASLGGFGNQNFISRPSVLGLSLVTSKAVATIFIDGRPHCRPLTDEEKKFQITEHTIGAS